jgi:PTH1 family peptidyl-tRNA hydrolase
VVGLGNPGSAYADNRHNVGFRTVTAFAGRHRFAAFARRGDMELSRGRHADREVLLVKPQAYMNRSGEVVLALVEEEGITPEEMLVVVDDVYLPLGRLRMRRGGGDGGHNGLRSIVAAMGDSGFPRLRFGVGSPAATGDLADYVLEDFSVDEQPVVEQSIDRAVHAVAVFLGDGIEAAMNRFNAAPDEDGDAESPAAGGA